MTYLLLTTTTTIMARTKGFQRLNEARRAPILTMVNRGERSMTVAIELIAPEAAILRNRLRLINFGGYQ